MNFLNKLQITKDFSIPKEKFDLQSHSYFSDGRKSPEDLLHSAHNNGYKYISITDHNSVQAYNQPLFELASELGITIIPGVELECFGELDVLAFDSQENSISPEFSNEIAKVTKFISEKRNKYLQEGIDNIVDFLKSSSNIPWVKWGKKDQEKKNEIISALTIKNASNINLDTAKLENFNREYISKPHLAMLLARFDLVDLTLFASTFSIPIEKAPKYAMGMLFDKYIKWPLDGLKPDNEIIEMVSKIPFVKVIAHPGKSFEIQQKENQDLAFGKYVQYLLDSGLDGAEIDYRNYKNTDANYNEKTTDILIKQQRTMYGTGGSDTHKLFT